MKIRTTILPAAICAMFLAVVAGAQERQDTDMRDPGAQDTASQKRRPDSWITTKVKTTLATRRNVSAIGTKVDTKNGVVTLRGEVKNEAEKELAERYAKEVEGVRRVDNRLVIKGEETGELREDDRGATGKGGTGIEGAGDRELENIGDAGLTGRVKAALAKQPETSAFHTDVDSQRGAVTLSGTAKSEAERDLAEKVARGVKGVKEVDNRIEVR